MTVHENVLEQRLKRFFAKALINYRLIDDGDHVLIALSGGKDSLLLTELLGKRSLIHRPQFKVSAIHVQMENIPYETDTEYLSTFCASNHVDLHIVSTKFNPEPQTESNAKSPNVFFVRGNGGRRFSSSHKHLAVRRLRSVITWTTSSTRR